MAKTFLYRIRVISVCVLLFLGCGAKKDKEEGLTQELLNVPLSTHRVDLLLPVDALKVGLNNKLPKLLVDERVKLNKRDNLDIVVARTRSIDMAYRNGLLYVSAPIEVTAVLEKKVMGVTLTNKEQPVVFRATVQLASLVEIDNQWNIRLGFEWKDLIWEDPPVFDLLGLRLDLSGVLEKQLETLRPDLQKRINDAIRQKLDLRSVVEKIYQQIQQPQKLKLGEEQLFLHLDIKTLGASMEAVKVDTLLLSVEAELNPRVLIDEVSIDSQPLPKKGEVKGTDNYYDTSVELYVPMTEINNKAEQYVKGKSYTVEDYNFTAQEIEVRSEFGYIYSTVQIAGDVSGKVEFYGVPRFSESLSVSVDQFGYQLLEGNELISVTDAVMHNTFEKMIADYLTLDLSAYAGDLDQLINRKIESLPMGDKVDFILEIDQLQIVHQAISHEAYQVVIKIKGTHEIILEEAVF